MLNGINVEMAAQFRRDQFFKFFVALVCPLSSHPTEAHRKAMHVHVDGKHVAAKRIHEHAFGDFRRHAR